MSVLDLNKSSVFSKCALIINSKSPSSTLEWHVGCFEESHFRGNGPLNSTVRQNYNVL
jgi:hypothetical protein